MPGICGCGRSSGDDVLVEEYNEQIQRPEDVTLSNKAQSSGNGRRAPETIVQGEHAPQLGVGAEIVQQQDRTDQTIYPDSKHVSVVGRHILTDTGAPGKAGA